MDPTKSPSDSTNIYNFTIYVHLKTLKLCDLPSRCVISSHYVQIYLKYIQVYQDLLSKQNLTNIIEDNKNLHIYFCSTTFTQALHK